MATLSTAVPIALPVSDVAKALPQRQRHITPQRGRALERLGHAIEYLVDECIHEGDWSQTSDDRLGAVQLLTDLRKRVYLEAPEIVPLSEKLKQFALMLLP